MAHRLLSLHNLWHLGRLMAEARAAIERGQLQGLIEARRLELSQGVVS
ncbi:MAG: hypothetical protein WB020_06325 [Candidatus Dormiibacterota bacterium]